MTVQIITIDGPSGSGKGTLAAKLAAHYQFHLLDSGALYRLLGLALHKQNLLDQLDTATESMRCYCNTAQYSICDPAQMAHKCCLMVKMSRKTITTERVGEYASKVAAVPELRTALLARQHAFAQAPGFVADGRDMATSIFPKCTG